jgi:hypothetical protein
MWALLSIADALPVAGDHRVDVGDVAALLAGSGTIVFLLLSAATQRRALVALR